MLTSCNVSGSSSSATSSSSVVASAGGGGGGGSGSGSGASTLASKFDVDQLIKDYDPEVGLTKFLADHVRLPMRNPKGTSIATTSPLKSAKVKGSALSNLEKKHRYFQQPGQEHNRDRCDACLGIGSIICCDNCPASFHMKCFDPPIVEDSLGQVWQCRECSSADITVETVHIDFPYEVTTKTVEESLDTPPSIEEEIQTHRDELESPGSEVSPGVSPVFSMYDAVKFGRNRRKRPAYSPPLSLPLPQSKKPKMEIKQPATIPKFISEEMMCALKMLKVQCLRSNPTEFVLPESFSTQEPIVGSSSYNQRKREIDFFKLPRSETKQPVCVDLESCVPTNPLRLCYECGKSCMEWPLITCDYCPAAFHLECTDPPLTAWPQGRWMCPLHPNHSNPNLARSTSWSTRVNFHEQFDQPIDIEIEKRQFYANLHKSYPPWVCSGETKQKPPVDVPLSIKDMYRNVPRAKDNGNVNDGRFDKKKIQVDDFEKLLNDDTNKIIAKGLLELTASTSTSSSMHDRLLAPQDLRCESNEEISKRFESELDAAVRSLSEIDLADLSSSYAVLFNMQNKTLSIMKKPWICLGSDEEICDVVLPEACRKVSPKHAVLFYDVKCDQFEVLNYSQHGLTIDGIHLGCDVIRSTYKSNPTSNVVSDHGPLSTIDSIRSFMQRCLVKADQSRYLSRINSTSSVETTRTFSDDCSCVSTRHETVGWEGPAFVTHGSVLTIGCMPLIFSIL